MPYALEEPAGDGERYQVGRGTMEVMKTEQRAKSEERRRKLISEIKVRVRAWRLAICLLARARTLLMNGFSYTPCSVASKGLANDHDDGKRKRPARRKDLLNDHPFRSTSHSRELAGWLAAHAKLVLQCPPAVFPFSDHNRGRYEGVLDRSTTGQVLSVSIASSDPSHHGNRLEPLSLGKGRLDRIYGDVSTLKKEQREVEKKCKQVPCPSKLLHACPPAASRTRLLKKPALLQRASGSCPSLKWVRA